MPDCYILVYRFPLAHKIRKSKTFENQKHQQNKKSENSKPHHMIKTSCGVDSEKEKPPNAE